MLGHGEWLLAGTFTLAAEVEVLLRVPGPSWRQAITAATGLSLVIVRWRSRPLLAMAGLVAAAAGARRRDGGPRRDGPRYSPPAPPLFLFLSPTRCAHTPRLRD